MWIACQGLSEQKSFQEPSDTKQMECINNFVLGLPLLYLILSEGKEKEKMTVLMTNFIYQKSTTQVSKYCKPMSCFDGFINTPLKINVCIDLAYHCISISTYKWNFESENMSILEVSSSTPCLRIAPAFIL